MHLKVQIASLYMNGLVRIRNYLLMLINVSIIRTKPIFELATSEYIQENTSRIANEEVYFLYYPEPRLCVSLCLIIMDA